VDADVVAFLCDGRDLDERALYPNCDGSDDGPPPPPAEVTCDGIDNDGDGTVDEGSSYTRAWSYTGGAGGSAGAGAIRSVRSDYSEYDSEYTFTAVIAGSAVNGAAIIVNQGGVPGSDEAPEIYVDCNSGSPIVSVYAYNAHNMFTAHSDGSNAAGIQAPDRVVSSLNDADFLRSAACSFDGTNTTMTLTVDATEINAHTPLYSSVWPRPIMDADLGVWFYPVAGARFTYSGGWVTGLTVPTYGGYDIHRVTTTETTECH
jgi:hypothetical protein